MESNGTSISIIDHGTSARRRLPRWQVHLTDGSRTYFKERFDDPGEALTAVKQWQAVGCAIAFQSAYVELLEAYATSFRGMISDVIDLTIKETLRFVQAQQPVAVP